MLCTGHTSLLKMKMCLLSIYVQHTAIMPQVNNNVDNSCNTVIMKYVWKKSIKKQTLITVPVNHFITQSFSQQRPDVRMLGHLTQWRRVYRLNRPTETLHWNFFAFFSSLNIHALAPLSQSLITRSSVGRKIHTYI